MGTHFGSFDEEGFPLLGYASLSDVFKCCKAVLREIEEISKIQDDDKKYLRARVPNKDLCSLGLQGGVQR